METPESYHQSQAAAAAAAANNATAGFCNPPPFGETHCIDNSKPTTDHFIVEDLLDFSNEDDDESPVFTAADSSTLTVLDNSSNSSSFSDPPSGFHPPPAAFSDPNDLCVPYDELAELEWLSNFVEESFSSEDLQKLQLISGIKSNQSPHNPCTNIPTTGAGNHNTPIFNDDVSVPAKARSKRSRAAACNWASRLLVLSPTSSTSSSAADPPEITVDHPPPPPLPAALLHHNQSQYPAIMTMGKKTVKLTASKKRDGGGAGGGGSNGSGEGRKCLHCATDKTPQWRTGPLGPKTLCNACGVRYKSGRLVPEYRPAASPTFVLTKHSNSHRKVMELRRQKEMMMRAHHPVASSTTTSSHHQEQFLHGHSHHNNDHHHHHHHQSMVFDVSSNGGGDDYLIHQHVGPDFRQLI